MTARPSFLTWYLALVPSVPTAVRCHLPRPPLDARRRELVAAVAAGAAHSNALAAAHVAWHDLLGPAQLHEVDDEVLAWVADVASGAVDLDLDDLPQELDPGTRQALGAIVAREVVGALGVRSAASLVDRVVGRRPRRLRAMAADLGAAVAGLPVAAPTMVAGAAMGVVGLIAPPAARIDMESDPNLMAQLLAETLPTWLGSAWGRTLVATLPVAIPVAVRSGRSGATVRVGRGRVEVANGVADDVWALLDGEIDSLLQAGSHTLTREVRAQHLHG